MCGRFVGAFSTERLLAELGDHPGDHGLTVEFDSEAVPYESRPTFNLAPTQMACVLRSDDHRLVADTMAWGLVPRWAKDTSRASSMINARSETVHEKPSFRGLLAGHRCVVPMDGFYEWDRTDPKHKVPFFCHRADERLLLVAGLWTPSPVATAGATFCILTRESGPDLSGIHDRSPVHLDADDAMRWLAEPSAPLELVSADHQPRLATRRVSTKVNSVRNNDASLLETAPPENPPGTTGDAPTLF